MFMGALEVQIVQKHAAATPPVGPAGVPKEALQKAKLFTDVREDPKSRTRKLWSLILLWCRLKST